MAETTYAEAIRQGIWEEMERDDTVFVMGEDVGVYGGAFKITKGMVERFGELRVVDTPLAESGIVGAGTGAAINGQVPLPLGPSHSDGDPRSRRRQHPRGPVPFAERRDALRAYAGPEGGAAIDCL